MNIEIQRIVSGELSIASDILTEAADWLRNKGEPLWESESLVPEKLKEELKLGTYYFAAVDGTPAGVYRSQEKDTLFWPDAIADEAVYIHRLSVRRAFAGKGIALALIDHAIDLTKGLNRQFLRLDCETTRPKLRSFYERAGFKLHSLSQVGHFSAARYEMNLNANNTSHSIRTAARHSCLDSTLES